MEQEIGTQGDFSITFGNGKQYMFVEMEETQDTFKFWIKMPEAQRRQLMSSFSDPQKMPYYESTPNLLLQEFPKQIIDSNIQNVYVLTDLPEMKRVLLTTTIWKKETALSKIKNNVLNYITLLEDENASLGKVRKQAENFREDSLLYLRTQMRSSTDLIKQVLVARKYQKQKEKEDGKSGSQDYRESQIINE